MPGAATHLPREHLHSIPSAVKCLQGSSAQHDTVKCLFTGRDRTGCMSDQGTKKSPTSTLLDPLEAVPASSVVVSRKRRASRPAGSPAVGYIKVKLPVSFTDLEFALYIQKTQYTANSKSVKLTGNFTFQTGQPSACQARLCCHCSICLNIGSQQSIDTCIKHVLTTVHILGTL